MQERLKLFSLYTQTVVFFVLLCSPAASAAGGGAPPPARGEVSSYSFPPTSALQRFGAGSAPSSDRISLPSNQEPEKKKKGIFSGSSLVVIFAVLDAVALAAAGSLFCGWRRKRARARETQPKAADADVGAEVEPASVEEEAGGGGVGGGGGMEDSGKLTFMGESEGFELDDLLKASAEALGKGNFGACYKAVVEGGRAVVVKRLKDISPLTREEFGRQVGALAALRHPNLLPLLAYFYSPDDKLLVFKFAGNGNLYDRLHGGRGKNRVPFRWPSRLRVAQAVARALAFLHRNTRSPAAAPHGNVKCSNVLLSDGDTPLLSDHGYPALVSGPVVLQRLAVYKSPEYYHRHRLSPKSDVWCYGSLLLELLTGRLSTLSAPPGAGGVDLCSWVYRAVREEWTAEIFDAEIRAQRGGAQGMVKLLTVALRCCEKLPEKRPEMEEVVREVEAIRVGEVEEEGDDSSEQSFVEDLSSSTNASATTGEER